LGGLVVFERGLAKIEMVKGKTADNSCSIKSDGKRQQERKAGKIL